MSEINKGYYAILPAPVRYSKELAPNEKLMYAEVSALTNEYGYCWANNAYFADLYEVHKNTVSRWISTLEKAGFFYLVFEEQADGTYERKIFIDGDLFLRFIGVNEKVDTPKQKSLSPYTIEFIPLNKKVKYNNKLNIKHNTKPNKRTPTPSGEEEQPGPVDHTDFQVDERVSLEEYEKSLEEKYPEPPTLFSSHPERVKEKEKSCAKKEKVEMPWSSGKFGRAWQYWKDYKKEEHKFRYKSEKSEQASLIQLNNMAKGDEETAIEIIRQSIANGWKGFFELKKDNHGKQSGKRFSEDIGEVATGFARYLEGRS